MCTMVHIAGIDKALSMSTGVDTAGERPAGKTSYTRGRRGLRDDAGARLGLRDDAGARPGLRDDAGARRSLP